ncbi:MAG: apolipoprotein N-acyltransferase, partial [Gammaproteobacteria bacterium]|nr:apolipoprotein N-acyltransferase [Gammaproteobacteria bacterium]
MRYVVATLTGVATVLGFAPFSWQMIGLAAPALLFYLWLNCSPKQGALVGFLYGLGLFGVGVSWVYVSLHDFGGMPVALAGVTVVLFVLVLAAFPAAVGWAQARWFRSGLLRASVVIPALWVIAEWSRGWVLTGFPWLALGYTQVGNGLSGFAPLAGVYAVSAAAAVTAGALAALVHAPGIPRLVLATLIAAGLWAMGLGLSHWEWVRPFGQPKPVTLVQGNVPLLVKWAPEQRLRVLKTYRDLSRNSNSQLVVWPESAIPYYIDELSPEFRQWLRGHPADFVLGVLERRSQSGKTAYYNSVLAVSRETSLYRKVHLVPFGEYLPFASLLGWLLDYLHIPMSDFSSWQGPQELSNAAGLALGITVCYEDAFPGEVRKALPEATLLVNVSEDAWFG